MHFVARRTWYPHDDYARVWRVARMLDAHVNITLPGYETPAGESAPSSLAGHLDAFPIYDEASASVISASRGGNGSPNFQLVAGKWGNAVQVASGYSPGLIYQEFSPAIALIDGGLTLEWWVQKPGGTGTPGFGNTWRSDMYVAHNSWTGWLNLSIFTYYSSGLGQYKSGIEFSYDWGSGYEHFVDYTTSLPDSDFHAVALVVDGTVFRAYFDGVQVLSGTMANMDLNGATFDYADLVNISDPYYLGIKVDEVRVTPAALYTSNYTPATAPFTS